MTTNEPLRAEPYDEMLERIRSGAWETGDRVPSEKTLIAEFGSTRGTVRQALATLRSEGLITGGRGAPPRVQRPVPAQSFDTFRSFTEWAKAEGFVPGQRIVDADTRPANETVARELGVRPEDTIVEIVRLRTLDGEPAMLERSTFAHDIGSLILSGDLDGGSVYHRLAELGILPARAKHVIDAVAAHPLDAEWLRVSAGFPLLRSRRVTTAADGTVIEYADDRHLPSMTTFVVESSAEDGGTAGA